MNEQELHPSVRSILRFFETSHLPEDLRAVSERFRILAWMLAETLPSHPETIAGLRKLLEAKDCAVRARLVARYLEQEATP